MSCFWCQSRRCSAHRRGSYGCGWGYDANGRRCLGICACRIDQHTLLRIDVFGGRDLCCDASLMGISGGDKVSSGHCLGGSGVGVVMKA
ncbi:hypothetical protein GQ53DRAFT_751192 [Thozetella sp. PMI_491]|nr:hypothetical protein GQ53DRAFT_751192 [Thozetella sp. PMI_491]